MADNQKAGDGALDQYWAFLKETYRQKYSEVAADHMVFPRNSGELPNHSCFGIVNDDKDETLAICDECITCTACASAVTELAIGKTIAEVLTITSQEVIDSLQGLPEEDQHCANLAVDTIKTAINDYLGY
jgi:nitrogen fixation NifU-like protein